MLRLDDPLLALAFPDRERAEKEAEALSAASDAVSSRPVTISLFQEEMKEAMPA
jgi:hypothetical protein